MKQVWQRYRDGNLKLTDVPTPRPQRGCVLVRTMASLVSVGTEKYMLELARKSLVGKAVARPDLVRQVIAKSQAEGILEAWRQAMGRLDMPVPLGYSSAGVVIDVGPGVQGFAVGDRVACTGSGYAGHAEVVSVPVNLCVKIPEGVSFESAAFVALGGIALEAVRMARVSEGLCSGPHHGFFRQRGHGKVHAGTGPEVLSGQGTGPAGSGAPGHRRCPG